jgi:molecular chaperone DnaJ
MAHLELDAEEFSIDNLKKQYKKLAKTCHPDLHPEDKEAEEKFKRLTEAYKKLLEKLS